MRIKITFKNLNCETYLPINTNYYLVKLINYLTSDYKRYLKALVPAEARGNNFDMYTFSQLIIPQRNIEDFRIGILSEEFHWYVASPFHQFLGLLAKELRQRKQIKIAKRLFGVHKVEFIDAPVFEKSVAHFTCLSPVAVYRQHQQKRRGSFYMKSGYILPDDRDYIKNIKRDLIQKFNAVQHNEMDAFDFDLQFDQNYIRRRNNRITKVITLENGEKLPEQVRGVLAPFRIKAKPEILKLVYDSGLGQLNNFGFGMVERVN